LLTLADAFFFLFFFETNKSNSEPVGTTSVMSIAAQHTRLIKVHIESLIYFFSKFQALILVLESKNPNAIASKNQKATNIIKTYKVSLLKCRIPQYARSSNSMLSSSCTTSNLEC
jgi:hypothetical protein